MIAHIVRAQNRKVVCEQRRAVRRIYGAKAESIRRRRLHEPRRRLVIIHAVDAVRSLIRSLLRWWIVVLDDEEGLLQAEGDSMRIREVCSYRCMKRDQGCGAASALFTREVYGEKDDV